MSKAQLCHLGALASLALAPSYRVGDVVGVVLATEVGALGSRLAGRVQGAGVETAVSGVLSVVLLDVEEGVDEDTAGDLVADSQAVLRLLGETVGHVGAGNDGGTDNLALVDTGVSNGGEVVECLLVGTCAGCVRDTGRDGNRAGRGRSRCESHDGDGGGWCIRCDRGGCVRADRRRCISWGAGCVRRSRSGYDG